VMRRLTEKKIVIASQNRGKLHEIAVLLRSLGIEGISAPCLGLEAPPETEDTFAGNARIKSHAAAINSGLPALSDDSGITVDALDGQPGVFTADWAETAHGRDFPMAMTKVWNLLEEVNAPSPRLAQFRCTLCLTWPDGHDEFFEGICTGSLTWPMRGNRGFGFDPIFIPDGDSETFGEMDPDRKNAMSHRAVAFAKFKSACLNA